MGIVETCKTTDNTMHGFVYIMRGYSHGTVPERTLRRAWRKLKLRAVELDQELPALTVAERKILEP